MQLSGALHRQDSNPELKVNRLLIYLWIALPGASKALPPAQLIGVRHFSGVVAECHNDVDQYLDGKSGYYWLWLKETKTIEPAEIAGIHSILKNNTSFKLADHRMPTEGELLVIIPSGFNGHPELKPFEPGDRVAITSYAIRPNELNDDPGLAEPEYHRIVVTRKPKTEQATEAD